MIDNIDTTDRPEHQVLFNGLFARFFCEDIPAEVTVIAILLLIGGCQGILTLLQGIVDLSLVYNQFASRAITFTYPLWFAFINLTSLLSVLKIVTAVFLLRKTRNAHRWAMGLLAALIVERILMAWALRWQTVTPLHLYYESVAHGAVSVMGWLLLYGLFICILSQPHVRRAFGQNIQDDNGDEPRSHIVFDQIDRLYAGMLGASVSLSIAIIAVHFIRDGFDELSSHLVIIPLIWRALLAWNLPMLNESLHNILIVTTQTVGLVFCGVFAIVLGFALLRHGVELRGRTLQFLALSTVVWLLGMPGLVKIAARHDWTLQATLHCIESGIQIMLVLIMYAFMAHVVTRSETSAHTPSSEPGVV